MTIDEMIGRAEDGKNLAMCGYKDRKPDHMVLAAEAGAEVWMAMAEICRRMDRIATALENLTASKEPD